MYDYDNFKNVMNEVILGNIKNKPIAIIMMGVPASGKSTLINKIVVDYGINEILSIDNLAEEYAKNNDMNYKAAITSNFKEFKKEMLTKANHLKDNKIPFVWDQVNSNKNIRMGKLGALKKDFYIIGICLNPDTSDILDRIIDRKLYSDKDLSVAMMSEISKTFTSPSLSEGFNDVIYVGKKIVKLSENENYKLNNLDLSKEIFDKRLTERNLLVEYYKVYDEKKKISMQYKEQFIENKKKLKV